MFKENLYIKKIFDKAFKHYKNGNLKEAEILFEIILKKKSNHLLSNFLLGTLLAQVEQYQNAIKLFKRSIKINPDYAQAHSNLGNVYQEIGNYKEAVLHYQNALKINKNFAEAHYNLGNVYQELGSRKESISSYQKAIQINPNYIKAYNNLGSVYQDLGFRKESLSSYQKAIQINPNYAIVYNGIGNLFKGSGETQKAILNYEKAINLEPNNLTFNWLSMNVFPIVYKNSGEIIIYRKRFKKNIKKIKKLLDTQSNYTKKQIIDALKSSTNFYLPYQGMNDLKLQKEYAELIERLTEVIYPQFTIKKNKNFLSKKIKIGFISSYFRNHSISKIFKNWILKLNKKMYKIFIYYADNRFDYITNSIKEYSDNFFSHTNVDQLINQISKDSLDVLIYLDIGMSTKMQILGSLRLAPLQCLAMGHPVTSGFKNIDYFLSSELMEIQSSQNHYSERLIKLPNTGQCLEKLNLKNIKSKRLSTKLNKIFFLNLQSLFKLLPQDDHIYLDIIKKQPNSCFCFIQAKSNLITSIFKKRISKLFQNEDLTFEKYSYFYQRGSQDEFLAIIEQSDIILDSLNWSGNVSSHEAISLNKPIVTLPSSFMRGRHTYSILKILDINETIANSKEEYVKIAVKLANDINFKNAVIDKIKKNKNKLFNDEKPIRFLEDFFKKQQTTTTVFKKKSE